MNIYSVTQQQNLTQTHETTLGAGAGELAGTVRARGGGVSSAACRAARSGVENIELNWENVI